MCLWLAVILSSTCNAFASIPESTTDFIDFESAAYCDDGWIQYEQKCFKLEASQPMEWTNASEYCRTMGGHLASIHSKNESVFLEHHLLSRNNPLSRNNALSTWIGLYNIKIHQEFAWDDGSNINYTNWGPFEPLEDHWGKGDCVEIAFTRSNIDAGTWFILPCNTKRAFLCQKQISGITIASVQTDANQTIQTVVPTTAIDGKENTVNPIPRITITSAQTLANQTIQPVVQTTIIDNKEDTVTSIPGITITSVQTDANQTIQTVVPTTTKDSKGNTSTVNTTLSTVDTREKEDARIVSTTTNASKDEIVKTSTSIHTMESKGIYNNSATSTIESKDTDASSDKFPTTIKPSKKEIVSPVPTPEIQIINDDNSSVVTSRISPNRTITDPASTATITSRKDDVSFVLTTEITSKRENNHPVLTTETTSERNNVQPVLSTETTSEKNKIQPVVPTTEKSSDSSTGHPVLSTEKIRERNNNHPVLTTENTIERNNAQPVGVTEKISERDKSQLGAMFITTLVVILALVIIFISLAVFGGKKYCVRPCLDHKHLKSETVLLMSAESTFERSIPVDIQDQDKEDTIIRFSQL